MSYLGLAEEEAFYTNEEQQWIKRIYVTYIFRTRFIFRKRFFRSKPSFGREGDTITIRDKDENIMLQNAHQTYKASLPIFQKYIELPVVSLETEKGIEKLSYVFGSF